MARLGVPRLPTRRGFIVFTSAVVSLASLGNHDQRSKMTRQIQKLVMAIAALALGGAVFAQAQTPPKAAQQRTSAPDRGKRRSQPPPRSDCGSKHYDVV
jgi:Na+/H+-dicarboxylate symporter